MSIQTFDANAPAAVFAFLDGAVSPHGREYWCWKYRTATAGAPSAFYWQEADGRVLGFIGLMRTALHAGVHRYPAAWFVDWHVTPGERGIGVGLGLLRKAEAAAGTLLTLQGSPDTRRILPRLGWKQSDSPSTWVLRLTARALAAGAERRVTTWLRPATQLAGAAASLYYRCRQPAALPDVERLDVDRFPADYDAVWQMRAAELPPAMSRDSAYVNYLCADYPSGGYRLQLVRARGEIVGHSIRRLDTDRRGLQRGRIVDLVWPRAQPELADWLVRSACWDLQEAGADYIECVLSVAELRAAVRQARFRARGPVPLWYHRLPADVPDPEHWHITFLDCDRAYR